MRRETSAAIGGVVLAGVIFVGGQTYADKLGTTARLLQVVCEEWVISPYDEEATRPQYFKTYEVEDSTDGKVISIVAMAEPTAARLKSIFSLPLVDGDFVMLPSCNYSMPEGALLPVQQDLAAARRKHEAVDGMSAVIALVVAALLLTPFIWFFLLDRLQELSNAIRGRPPR